MTALPERVQRKLDAVFPRPDTRSTVAAELSEYFGSAAIPEPERVVLAILKLSGGDASELTHAITAARGDYRDVLAWAEYPEEMRLGFRADPHVVQNARKRDREQYLAWLGAGQES